MFALKTTKRAIKTLGTYTNKVQNMYINYSKILLNIGNTKNKRVCVRACLRARRRYVCPQYYRRNVFHFVHDMFLCLWLVNCLPNTNRTTVINVYLRGVYNIKCSIINRYYIISITVHPPYTHFTKYILRITAKGFDA